MQTVYIETTIPSFYFETRTAPLMVAWRDATRDWWTRFRSRYDLVTSRFVLNELGAGPARKAEAAIQLLEGVRVLPNSAEVERVAAEYIRRKLMPAGSVGDAAHLAMASVHAIDFILTWNCKHLANANKVRHIRGVNEQLGLAVPIITTPLALVTEEQ